MAKSFPRELALGKKMSGAEKTALTSGLRSLHRILSKLLSLDVTGKEEKLKVLWILGRYASPAGHNAASLHMNVDRFKQYAFGVSRAKRVFNQLKDFNVHLDFEESYDGDGSRIEMDFKNDNGEIAQALQRYIEQLVERQLRR